MAFKRIAILGVGLMGGSVGLACRSILKDCHIIGYGHRGEDLQLAVDRGAIHEFTTDAGAAAREADLAILCTPVGVFSELMASIAPALKPGAVVTDVGSTKRSIAMAAQRSLPPSVHFIGSHPMVGGEKHGIANARADLLGGALCIITAGESADPLLVDRIEDFWRMLKMRTVRMTPQLHDQLTAEISHLPHALAAALVRMQSPQALAIAARGFLDTTRIAGGDPALWRDILLDNRDNLKAAIARLQRELGELSKGLDATDPSAVEDWLKTAARLRTNPNSA